ETSLSTEVVPDSEKTKVNSTNEKEPIDDGRDHYHPGTEEKIEVNAGGEKNEKFEEAEPSKVDEDAKVASGTTTSTTSIPLYKPKFHGLHREEESSDNVVSSIVKKEVETAVLKLEKTAETNPTSQTVTNSQSPGTSAVVSTDSIELQAAKIGRLIATSPKTAAFPFANMVKDEISSQSTFNVTDNLLQQNASLSSVKPPVSASSQLHGSITQGYGTPMVRSPLTSSLEQIHDKVKQSPALLVNASSAVLKAVGIGSTTATASVPVDTSTTTSATVASTSLQPSNLTSFPSLRAASTLPFGTSGTPAPTIVAPFATASADNNDQSAENLLLSCDPRLQYLKLLQQQQQQQQELEQRVKLAAMQQDLAVLNASSLTQLDLYRQIMAMGLSDQQAQQHLAALSADPRLTIWQMLQQQQQQRQAAAAAALLKQQQQTASETLSGNNINAVLAGVQDSSLLFSTPGLLQAAASSIPGLMEAVQNIMLGTHSTTPNAAAVAAAVAAESQQQLARAQLSRVVSPAAVAAASMDLRVTVDKRPSTDQQRMSASSGIDQQQAQNSIKLLNKDYEKAEQIRREKFLIARQTMDMYEKKIADVKRYQHLEQRMRNVEQDEQTLISRRLELQQQEIRIMSQARIMPEFYIKNPELLTSVTEEIKRNEEKISALNHVKRSLQESLRKLDETYLGDMPGSSGVIVRGASEDRSIGLVSKGAVKEFPASLGKQEFVPATVPSSLAAAALIGMNRTQNDLAATFKKDNVAAAAAAVAVAAAAAQQQSQAQLYMAQLAQHMKPPDPSGPSLTLGRAAPQFRSDQASDTKLDNRISEQNRQHIQNIEKDVAADVKRKTGLFNALLPSKVESRHSPGVRNARPVVAANRVSNLGLLGKSNSDGDNRQLSSLGGPSIHQGLSTAASSSSPRLPNITSNTKSTTSRSSSPSSQFSHLPSVVSSSFSPAALRQSISPQVLSVAQPSSHSPVQKISAPPVNTLFAPSVSTAAASAVGVPSMISPRSNLSVNSSRSSTHPSPQSSGAFTVPTPGSSPFQISPSLEAMSSNINASPHGTFNSPFQIPSFASGQQLGISGGLFSTAASNSSAVPVEAGSKSQKPSENQEKVQPSSSSPGSFSASDIIDSAQQLVSSSLVKTECTVTELLSNVNTPTTQARVTPSYSNDYEPLSPDAVDSSPSNVVYPSSSQAATPEQNGMRLFSMLNLPESGSNSSVSVRQGLSEFEESPREYEQRTATPPSAQPPHTVAGASTIVSSSTPAAASITKSGTENYFEPLSDDE
uniref:POU domain protein n=1 Tax=Syphacia muris TaxID=451379 RepID=A0A0N5AZ09_9BILA